eukprot:TRINITY_DN3029_c0_g1_i1.p1 TRINITY_DN3029_c0_g1~~TRINITY_DN3029_c0_g1_i1.p1  ORF type:complete len:1187 (+),score=271.71 TRINITY_DN3029_c0_g1_i1:60-3620(+)
MHLYHLTLQKPTAIGMAVCGNFSGTKVQEIAVVRGHILELLRMDESKRLQKVVSVDVFGVIRSISAFRLTGGSKDYIVLGSDSGKVVILEYIPAKNMFKKEHEETFGKTGCRRIVPGQYTAIDPKGRAIMIGAVEKQKLVYIMNRDAATRLTISSPLEAHKNHAILFSVVGVDVGFENPQFGCLELDASEVDEDPSGEAYAASEKQLTYYELDLGLNHVVRKSSESVDRTANMLIQVPGGSDGPGGLIVCAENKMYYTKIGAKTVLSAFIPRRYSLSPDRSVMIVNYTTFRKKDMFFFLCQSEYGDIYKVTLDTSATEVHRLRIKLFDSIPTAVSLCILKSGHLFAASEFGDHYLYDFLGIGDDPESVESTSDATEDDVASQFTPRPLLNLDLVHTLDSLSPLIETHIADLANENSSQIYSLCGRSSRSSLRALRYGLSANMIANSDLPGKGRGIWAIKRLITDEYHRYIIVSLQNNTTVLQIGESVEELPASENKFVTNATTLLVGVMANSSIIQVHPTGFRRILPDLREFDWKTPGRKQVVCAAMNEQQLVLGLNGGDVAYFTMDAITRGEPEIVNVGTEISCLDIAPLFPGEKLSRFMAVGKWDETVHILSTTPGSNLATLSTQVLRSQVESICILDVTGHGPENSIRTLSLNIGLSNGVLFRAIVDNATGQLVDNRQRYLGTKGVRLVRVQVRDSPGMLALSSRPWLCHSLDNRLTITPLSLDTVDYASPFRSEPAVDGFVVVSGPTLKVITVDNLTEVFNQQVLPLSYTPRKLVVHPTSKNIVILESDHNTESTAKRSETAAQLDSEHMKEGIVEDSSFGYPPAGQHTWASAIRVVSPSEMRTLSILELEDNENVLSACVCMFQDYGNEYFLVVGTAKDMELCPRKAACGFLHVYRFEDEGSRITLFHKTQIEGIPGAVRAYMGRLLVGAGRVLRIYDLGKKKLLRKCENKSFPNFITNIFTQNERIIVTDLSESFLYVKYHRDQNQLVIFADDVNPRWVTAASILDFDTMVGGDKFGNAYVARLPAEATAEGAEDAGYRTKWEVLTGAASHKVDEIIQFHVGDVITSITKASLQPGSLEAIIYTTIHGAIGAFLPFSSREDIDFFTHLEMHMRSNYSSLCGRDHLSYRSYYYPVKDVIDGDLCEYFSLLEDRTQGTIAEELERSPAEILKKLEDIRSKIL